MRTLLEVDIKHAISSLSALRVYHRIARSRDFLGTMLKVVTGTPDASDFGKPKLSEPLLIESNKR